MASGLVGLQFAATVNGLPPPTQQVDRALGLFLVLGVLLGVLVAAVVLLGVARRLRERANRSKPRGTPMPMGDPWAESANRVRVYQPKRPPDADQVD